MRARIWPAIAVSFGALILLLVLFALLVMREADRIQERTKIAHQAYKSADDAISEIETNIHKGALIENQNLSGRNSPRARQRVSDLERSTETDCTTLIDVLGVEEKPRIEALREGLHQYWSLIQKSLGAPGAGHGAERLSSELETQPETILDLVRRIDALNQANLTGEETQIEAQQKKLRDFAVILTFVLLFLECSIAIFSTAYMARLDKMSLTERTRAEKAEQELRHLSNQLVRLQEEERKAISRELHDEVGQMLTGLRMELGALSSTDINEQFHDRLDSVKRLAEESL